MSAASRCALAVSVLVALAAACVGLPAGPARSVVAVSTGAAPVTFAAPTAAPAPVGPPGPASRWRLVFHDGFNGTELDTARWRTCYHWSCTNAGNSELEWYTPANDTVSGGVLSLTAKRQPVTVGGHTYPYTSGMINTGRLGDGHRLTFAFQYGFAEIRADVPPGRGLWPAFWLLPAHSGYLPEIDVMEMLGATPHVVHLAFHHAGPRGQDIQTVTDWAGPNFTAGWHTFAIDWTPTSLTWYVDGIARKHYTDAAHIPHQPMYLLANLAVGGFWPGPPPPTTVFPASMRIDYVRVWQAAAPPPPPTAAGCAARAQTPLGSVRLDVTVPRTGRYRLWAHLRAGTDGADSVFARVDGGCPVVLGGRWLPAGASRWVTAATPASDVRLTAGPHTVTVTGRQAGVSVDRLLLLSDAGCVPVGSGTNCGAPGPSPGPHGSPSRN